MSLNQFDNLPGVTAQPDAATRDFVFNHTMLRVKNLESSLDFYTRVLGFTVVDHKNFPDGKFSLTFLALVGRDQVPTDPEARQRWRKSTPGILELTHNHGTENDAGFSYHDGNSDPRGFGHTCVAVPDIRAACARFEQLGVTFQKRLTDGSMKEIAFIKDPDGYWVEVIQFTPLS
ncbi:MAG: lactoylglutathione lyase [Pseudomonas oryzihabitans]